MTKEQLEEFKIAAEPLMKWLAENVHPHHTAILTSSSADLTEGKFYHSTSEFLKD